ncbi:cupin domain-containing protein [Streptomyces sp. MNU76]|uniref:cupin domain-containing protein n=1 Tax=Streptomyces sp. MNU76 TaxID=2560026 RepID=UPI0027DF3E5E|nr:cupin domain-containing protein [Streptomyces sp. MNU76]
MDAVSELLAEVRARGAVFRQTIMRPPWALRMASGAPLTLATMVRGRVWIVPDQHEPVPIGVGDIAVIRGDAPYAVADAPPDRTLAGGDQRRLPSTRGRWCIWRPR